jgi:hypothetical protein
MPRNLRSVGLSERRPGAKEALHGQRAAAQVGQRDALLGLGLRLGPAQAPGQVLVELLGVGDCGIEFGAQPGVLAVGQAFEDQAGRGGAGALAGGRLREHLSDSFRRVDGGCRRGGRAAANSSAVVRCGS